MTEEQFHQISSHSVHSCENCGTNKRKIQGFWIDNFNILAHCFRMDTPNLMKFSTDNLDINVVICYTWGTPIGQPFENGDLLKNIKINKNPNVIHCQHPMYDPNKTRFCTNNLHLHSFQLSLQGANLLQPCGNGRPGHAKKLCFFI